MLGHDMRMPLQAIKMTASSLQMLDVGREAAKGAARARDWYPEEMLLDA